MEAEVQTFTNIPQVYDRYRFTVTSKVAQSVYISLYTYSQAQYPYDCKLTSVGESEVFLKTDLDEHYVQANPGGGHSYRMQFDANDQLGVIVLTKFSSKDLLPHDWQLVVQGNMQKLIMI